MPICGNLKSTLCKDLLRQTNVNQSPVVYTNEWQSQNAMLGIGPELFWHSISTPIFWVKLDCPGQEVILAAIYNTQMVYSMYRRHGFTIFRIFIKRMSWENNITLGYNTMFLFRHFRPPYAPSTNTNHNISIYGAHAQVDDTYTYCRSHTILVQTISSNPSLNLNALYMTAARWFNMCGFCLDIIFTKLKLVGDILCRKCFDRRWA
jgi:hypothetical protein